MKIFKGKYLSVSYFSNDELFIISWNISPNNDKELLEELKRYEENRLIHKPKKTLWILDNWCYKLTEESKSWIIKNLVNLNNGFEVEKVAFVIGPEIEFHKGVIEISKNKKDTYKHFTTITEAKKWLLNNENTPSKLDTKITFDGVDEEGNPLFKFNKNDDISEIILFLDEINKKEKTISIFKDKINLLTERETEILKEFSNGKTLVQIAEDFFISEHTIRTHWKKIKKKLDVNDNKKIIKIAKTILK